MGGISGDNIIKFVLGISGLGLSLASFTLSRVFTLEEYAHILSEKIHAQAVEIDNLKTLTDKLDTIQRDRIERFAIVENKIDIIEEAIKDLRAEKRSRNE